MDKKKYSEQVFFCSAASRYFKEALQGTAANYKSFIMVEHASPFPSKPTDGLLDKSWLKRLDALTKKKDGKLLLIRNSGTGYKTCRVIFVDCVRQKYFVLQAPISEAHTIDVGSHIEDPATDWEVDPFFVVCTNGKKDKCCAKFGFPVFKFFENIYLPFSYNAWECTHLGGDRFAANAALMPYGIYYGRVEVEGVHEIIKQTAFGRVHYPNYRGRSTLSFFEQAVECHLREHVNDYTIHFSIKINKKEQNAGVITIDVHAVGYGNYKMVLQREVVDYPHLLTCTSPHPEKIVKYHKVSIEALE